MAKADGSEGASRELKVLLIEDNPADARRLAEAMRRSRGGEIEVLHAGRLEEGLRRLHGDMPQVALLDLSLPDAGRLEGLERLHRAAPLLPVVALAAEDDAELAERAFERGAQDFLVKELVDGAQLARSLRHAVARARAQRTLMEHEGRFRALVEHSSDVFTISDERGVIRYISPAVEEALGCRPEERIGKAMGETTHPEDLPRVRQAFGHIASVPGRTGRVEYRVRHRDGSWRIFESQGTNLLHHPVIRGFIANTRDVTAKREAERALRESEERFRALVQNSSDMLGILEADGTYRYLSPACMRILGRASEDWAGGTLADVTHPEDRPRLAALFGELRDSAPGSIRHLEHRVVTADGGCRLLESICTNRLDHPVIRGIVLNSRDVTRQREAEAALRDSEERYRRFFEEDLTGDCVVALDGRILACNPAFASMFGYASVAEAERGHIAELFPDRSVRRQLVERLAAERKIERYEVEGRRRDGRAVHVVGNVIGRFEESGKLVELKAYLFDDTERKEAEERLRQAQKMEAVGRLAGGMAHDFNNILTAMLFYAEGLVGALAADATLRRKAEEIKKGADRGAALTRQLLAFSRRQVLKPQVVSFNTVVRALEPMLRRLIGEDVELLVRLDPTVRNVKADPGQLEQVILNLAVNARDAMPQGGVLRIETAEVDVAPPRAAEQAVPAGPHVELAVADTGQGISEEVRNRIFEPFFTTKERGRGTGLGLSTVYGIVQQSGGCILVENGAPRGTVFRVRLPVIEEAESPPQANGAPAVAGGAETVLLVEDEEAIRTLFVEGLRVRGYRVLEAECGLSALAAAEGHPQPIDLMVSDIVMPDMRGPELVRRVRSTRPGLKVLFISGYAGEATAPDGGLEDGTPFLQKPFTAADLVRKVREVLDG